MQGSPLPSVWEGWEGGGEGQLTSLPITLLSQPRPLESKQRIWGQLCRSSADLDLYADNDADHDHHHDYHIQYELLSSPYYRPLASKQRIWGEAS